MVHVAARGLCHGIPIRVTSHASSRTFCLGRGPAWSLPTASRESMVCHVDVGVWMLPRVLMSRVSLGGRAP